MQTKHHQSSALRPWLVLTSWILLSSTVGATLCADYHGKTWFTVQCAWHNAEGGLGGAAESGGRQFIDAAAANPDKKMSIDEAHAVGACDVDGIEIGRLLRKKLVFPDQVFLYKGLQAAPIEGAESGIVADVYVVDFQHPRHTVQATGMCKYGPIKDPDNPLWSCVCFDVDHEILTAAGDNASDRRTVDQAKSDGACLVHNTDLGALVDAGAVDLANVFYWHELIVGPDPRYTENTAKSLPNDQIKVNVYVADYKTATGATVQATGICNFWSVTDVDQPQWVCDCYNTTP